MTNFSKKFMAKSHFKDRRTDAKTGVEKWHDHKGSGKTYGEKGHMGVYDDSKSPGPGYGDDTDYQVGYKKTARDKAVKNPKK